LKELNVETYATHVLNKAISSVTDDAERQRQSSLMDSIEGRLEKFNAENRFGYRGSEALVSLERCPNNTFPAYWLTKDAPFYRFG